MPDPWWICASCNSLNRQKARKCYSCGTANAAGQAEVIDLLDSGFIGRRGPGAPPPPAAVKPADAAAKGAVDQDRLRPGGLASFQATQSAAPAPVAWAMPATAYDDDEPLLKPVARPPAFVPANGDGPTGVAPYLPPGAPKPAAPAKRRIDWRFSGVTLLAVVVVTFFFATLTFAPPH
jgi:hypothetical protein